MSESFSFSKAEYYAVNDRPVKIVSTIDGGKEVLVMDLQTGKFKPDMSYLSRCYNPEQDVDRLSQIAFEQYVMELKRRIEEENQT